MTRDDSLADGYKHRMSPVVGYTPEDGLRFSFLT
jgi:hypothetical protein